MPIFRRFGRPGLLGAITRSAVIAGTAAVTARAVSGASTRLVAPPTAPTPALTGPSVAAPSLTQQLSWLSDLHAAGDISDAEFAQAKTQLLAGG
ncbi:MAG TPA: SHOCT domain-containing protein [Galbitalea sp.]|jgi:hypothetical protein